MTDPVDSKTRPSKAVLWTAMIVFTLVAGFVTLTALGLFLKGSPMEGVHWRPQEHAYHPQLGWTARPGYRNEQNYHPGFPFALSVEINAAGFRDRDWDEKLRSSPGERILLVGDSFLYGWASHTDDLFSAIAEELTRGHGIPPAFFNAGISAYGFHHYHRLVQVLADDIKPSQVWVMLTPNDVGDAALPYDHRYRERVFKPFFDETGRLTHDIVPQRASLRFKDTAIGNWSGLLALDELQYLAQNIGYVWSGLPTEYTSPLSIRRYDELIYDEATLRKFPAIGRMVRRNIEDIVKLSEQKRFALRFINNWSNPHFDKYFSGVERSYDRGTPVIPELAAWLPHINEPHPGFLWAVILAAHALKLELATDDKVRQAIARRLPAKLDFDSQLDASRALSGDHWGVTSERKLYLPGGQTGYLKLSLGDQVPPAGEFIVRLKTKHPISPSAIWLSDMRQECEQLDEAAAPATEFKFACTSRYAPLPYVGFFRIDVAQDVHFELAQAEAR